MKFSEWMIQYRDVQRLSQRAMADLLSVSPMTINRIENGQNFKATEQMALGLMRLNVSDQVLALNDDSEGYASLKRVFSYLQGKIEYSKFSGCLTMEDMVDNLARWFADIGFSEDDSFEDLEPTPFQYPSTLFVSKETGKKWLIAPMTTQFLKKNPDCVATYMGKLIFAGVEIHKLSVIILDLSASEIGQLKNGAQRLKTSFFDISYIIIPFPGTGFEEITMYEVYDGRGVFDLNVDGKKEEANKLLNNWLRVKNGYPVMP